MNSDEEIRIAIVDNVARGYAKVVGHRDGKTIFALTEEGERRVREDSVSEGLRWAVLEALRDLGLEAE